MKLTQPGASTADKILETTFNLLGQRGHANVSMRDIAQAAQVSVSQVAYHFGSREGLMAQVLRHVADHCYNEVEKLTSVRHIFKERLEILSEYFRGLHDSNVQLFRVLLDFMTQSIWVSDYRDEINRFFDRVGNMIADDIAAIAAEGEQQLAAVSSTIISSLVGSGFQAAFTVPDDGADCSWA